MTRPHARLIALVLVGLVPAACGRPGTRPAAVAATAASPSATPGPLAPSPATTPAFVATSAPVTAADLPYTWRPGCPVGPASLRLLRLGYWGFDERPHVGAMVVRDAVAGDVETVFRTLYRDRFPIRGMRPEDAFRGSDPDSMAVDNTSAFNCRTAVAPGPPQWSAHAYGEAVDVNTVENPYLEGASVLPPAGAAYRDRTRYRPGMAVPGGVLVRAFASVGWTWGGRWTSSPDYQHFSRTGG